MPQTIMCKLLHKREETGTTEYINSLTDTINAFYRCTLKDPTFSEAYMFEPEDYETRWIIKIRVPGFTCGEIVVEKQAQGQLSSIWRIKTIVLVSPLKEKLENYFLQFLGSDIILPTDNTEEPKSC